MAKGRKRKEEKPSAKDMVNFVQRFQSEEEKKILKRIAKGIDDRKKDTRKKVQKKKPRKR